MQSPTNQRLSELEAKWLDGSITPEEAKEYAHWYNHNQNNSVIIPKSVAASKRTHKLKIWTAIQAKIKQQENIPFKPLLLHSYRWAIAAAVLLLFLMGATYYWLQITPSSGDPKLLAAQINIKAPTVNKAFIILADGRQVLLNDAKDFKSNSGSEKQIINAASKQIRYNYLNNPKGSSVASIALADGTKVWLNAASSIRFPETFLGNERRVELSGEAYFEVAKNKNKPFIVQMKGNKNAFVQVYGTHFNIKLYDSANIKTTLLEGVVKVSNGNESVMLLPNQEANITEQHKEIKVNTISHTEGAIAWKNDWFDFRSENIKIIMKEIAAWYDVDIEYHGKINNETFTGSISRSSDLSNLIEVLKQSGIDCKLNGRKIIIFGN